MNIYLNILKLSKKPNYAETSNYISQIYKEKNNREMWIELMKKYRKIFEI